MATAKRVKRDGKEPAAGKLKQAALNAAKIFTPTKEQPTDPNAKAAKKPGMTNMGALLRAAQRAAPVDRMGGMRRVSMDQLRKWMDPWS